MSHLAPQRIVLQTISIFSKHAADEVERQLSKEDRRVTSRFYRGHSSRQGTLNDAAHTVGVEVLEKVRQPTLVIHSREDRSVPFDQAEWSLRHIPGAEFCEAGCTGHLLWVGPDVPRIMQRLIGFLRDAP